MLELFADTFFLPCLIFVGTVANMLSCRAPAYGTYAGNRIMQIWAGVLALWMGYTSWGLCYLGTHYPQVTLLHITHTLTLSFQLDKVGSVFATFVCALWWMTSLYFPSYLRQHHIARPLAFASWMHAAIACTLALAFASNIFTLFICYELLTLATYPLVTHKASAEALQAGRTYLLILMGASLCFLLPTVLWLHIQGFGGTFGSASPHLFSGTEALLVCIFLLLGIAKMALLPMHRWLVAAMVAPTPVSALLHAVAVVKSGVFFLIRVVFFVLPASSQFLQVAHGVAAHWMAGVACTTMVVAGILALRQTHLKRILAYSTMGQLAYCVAIISMGNATALEIVLFYMLCHGVAKITLFFAVGAMSMHNPTLTTQHMVGIAHKMPWTCAAFSIAALSMIGFPPLLGFIGKFAVLHLAWQMGQGWIIGAVLLSSMLAAGYFLPLIYKAYAYPFSDAEGDENHKVKIQEAPAGMLIAILCCASAVVLLPWALHPLSFLS